MVVETIQYHSTVHTKIFQRPLRALRGRAIVRPKVTVLDFKVPFGRLIRQFFSVYTQHIATVQRCTLVVGLIFNGREARQIMCPGMSFTPTLYRVSAGLFLYRHH